MVKFGDDWSRIGARKLLTNKQVVIEADMHTITDDGNNFWA